MVREREREFRARERGINMVRERERESCAREGGINMVCEREREFRAREGGINMVCEREGAFRAREGGINMVRERERESCAREGEGHEYKVLWRGVKRNPLLERKPCAESQHKVQRTFFVDSLDIGLVVKMVADTRLNVESNIPGQVGLQARRCIQGP